MRSDDKKIDAPVFAHRARPRPAGALLWIALGLFCAASTVFADARENHKQAVAAIEQQNYDEAIRLLREALNERLEERVGAFRRYLPHYYLGVALAGNGDCRAALESWAESERQGQILESADDAAKLRAGQTRCNDRLARLEQSVDEAEAALGAVEAVAREVALMRETPELEPFWTEGAPSYEERQRDGMKSLSEARQALQAAKRGQDPGGAENARTIAQRTVESFNVLKSEAEARLEELRQATTDSLEGLESMEKRASRALQDLEALRPLSSGLAKKAQALENTLDSVRRRKSSASAEDLQGLSRRLSGAVSELRRAAAGPPEDLANAVQAFLEGRRTETLEILDGSSFGDARARRIACVLASAARHSLWIEGGTSDRELARAAAEGALSCPEGVASLPEQYFSPSFRAFAANPAELIAALDAEEAAEQAAESSADAADAGEDGLDPETAAATDDASTSGEGASEASDSEASASDASTSEAEASAPETQGANGGDAEPPAQDSSGEEPAGGRR